MSWYDGICLAPFYPGTEAITSLTTLNSKIKKLEIHKSLQTLLSRLPADGNTNSTNSTKCRESPDDESVYFDALSSTYKWHSACIRKSASWP